MSPPPDEIEQRLRETEARFRIMADVAPVLLWMSREDGLCTFFNQTWLDFTGRTQEEEWGVGWAEGVHFEDLQRCMDTYLDAFNRRQVFEMEYRLRRSDGEYRWILDRGTPRYTPDGGFAGYIGSCIDITDRKIMEGELRAALQAKDEFLGLVSHELRTPLAALQLQLDRLRRDSAQFSPKQVDLLRRMEGSSARLNALIDSVLQFSRVARGRIRPQVGSFDLAALATATLDEVRPAADRKGLEVRLDVAPGLPPLTSDPDLVRLILSNLLTNAVKFTDRGSVALGLACQAGGQGHRVAVTDTGRGISPEDQSRIFVAFEQLEASRHKHTPGVGLGLALVKAMAEALGARIGVESAVGRGSTFSVLFPEGGPR